MFRTAKFLVLSTTLAALSAPLVHAQEMTADDILKRLQAQRSRTLAFVTESTPEAGEETTMTAQGATQDDTQTARTGALQLSPVDGAEAPVVAVAAMPAEVAAALTIDLTIYFDFDSAVLQTKSKTQLNALCQAIASDSGEGRYQIIGHTDSKGRAAYNQRLSQARADEVVRYMVSDCGIGGDRLQAVGQGEMRPADAANPGSSKNRRVEVQVLS